MEALLAKCEFSEGRDRLLLTGDAFTKGPDPLGVWRLLKRTGAKMVLGNHDAQLIERLRVAVSSQSPKSIRPGEGSILSQLSEVAEEVLAWLENLPLWIEGRAFDLVHAGVNPDKGIKRTEREEFLAIRTWPHTGDITGPRWHDDYRPGEKVLIFGHDAPGGLVVKRRQDGRPYLIGLDTGCVYGRQLTAYALEEDCVYQVKSLQPKIVDWCSNSEVDDSCNPPEVSAIVVNWNSGDMLQKCAEALLGEQDRLDLEVVVVDNGSEDGSVERLNPLPDEIRVIRTGENLGFGGAVNLGLEVSRGPFVAVLNPDVILKPGALYAMVRFLASEATAGTVGPTLYDGRGRVRRSCGSRPNLVGEICRKFLLHTVFPLFNFTRWRPKSLDETGWVTGACFVSRRTALENVNGMDDRFFMYYEDVDLCLRMKEAGWGVFYQPEAAGVHTGGWSSKQVFEEMLMASEVSYDYFVEKHLGNGAATLLAGLRPMEMVLRLGLWSVVYFLSDERRDEAGARLRAYRRMLAQGGRRISSAGENVK